MYYCRRCDHPVLLEPDPPLARCPACGSSTTVHLEPLFVVSGASGSGKTAVVPHLVKALPECVVFDADWIIEVSELGWPELRNTWLQIAHGVGQGGRPTVLVGPFLPEHLEHLPARRWVGPIRFAHLDCDDAVRRERLEALPAWRARDAEVHVEFAARLRRDIELTVRSDDKPLERVAAELAAWVRREPAGPWVTAAKLASRPSRPGGLESTRR